MLLIRDWAGRPWPSWRTQGPFWPIPVSTVGRCGPGWRRRLEPHIPLKGGGEVRDERRKRAKRVFSSALYRLRAVGEGLFGALKTSLACGFLQETSTLMAQKRALLEAVAYNLPLPLPWILRLFFSRPFD